MGKKKDMSSDQIEIQEDSDNVEQVENDISSETTSSEDEDDNVEELAGTFDKSFFKTLSSLKSKDPSIYNSSVVFFDGDESKPQKKTKTKTSEKPFLLKDYEREVLVNNKEHSESDGEDRVMTVVEGERKIKDEFKNILKDDSEDESNELGMGLLKKRIKTTEEKEKDEADYIQWLKGQKDILEDKNVESELLPLHDYWNNKNLDKNEEFLKDFILNKRFLEKDDENDDNNSINLSEDGRLLDQQDEFEHTYNHRFEYEATDSKRYPRKVENSMRVKDDRRKKKRAEIKERKNLEKEKKKEIIKKNQKEKLKEIEQKLEELKSLTGNDQCGFSEADILDDFDPDKHDKAMSKFYNDEFYNGTEEEKPDLSGLDLDNEWENHGADGEMEYKEEPNCEDPDFNMDCEAVKNTEKKPKLSRKKNKRRLKKAAATHLTHLPDAVYDPQVHESYQKYIDEYYDLDCEDFIDDLPCKYKYKPVQANDYGLTVEEILMADDKELQKWCPLSKLYQKRNDHVEANEVKIYKLKAEDISLKAKLLPSLFESEETDKAPEEDDADDDEQPDSSSQLEQKNKTSESAVSNKKQKIQKTSKGNKKAKEPMHKIQKRPFKKKEKYSNSRLNAYGIKAKAGSNKSWNKNRQ